MPIIDAALATLLEGPSAQNVAIADDDGAPVIGRAWGLRVNRGRTVRALVGADAATAATLRVDRPIAVLVIDLGTYWSVQVKGPVSSLEPATPADHQVHDVYVQEFRAALVAEGRLTPLDPALPSSIVAATFDVRSAFDQTPGPGAGRSLLSAP